MPWEVSSTRPRVVLRSPGTPAWRTRLFCHRETEECNSPTGWCSYDTSSTCIQMLFLLSYFQTKVFHVNCSPLAPSFALVDALLTEGGDVWEDGTLSRVSPLAQRTGHSLVAPGVSVAPLVTLVSASLAKHRVRLGQPGNKYLTITTDLLASLIIDLQFAIFFFGTSR